MLYHIIASPRSARVSRTRRLAEAFLEGFRSVRHAEPIEHFDLFEHDLAMTDAVEAASYIHKFRAEGLSHQEQDARERLEQFIEPLRRCDRLVISSPIWNFGPPWKLKQWLDVVSQPGLTFTYEGGSPRGLLNCRSALVATFGDTRPEHAAPHEANDYFTPMLETALAFLGAPVETTCIAAGLDEDPSRTEEIMAAAEQRAAALGANFARG